MLQKIAQFHKINIGEQALPNICILLCVIEQLPLTSISIPVSYNTCYVIYLKSMIIPQKNISAANFKFNSPLAFFLKLINRK